MSLLRNWQVAVKSILTFLILVVAAIYALYTYADSVGVLAVYIGWLFIIIVVLLVVAALFLLLGVYVFDRCPKGGRHEFEMFIGGRGGSGCHKCDQVFGQMSEKEAFLSWHRKSHG